METIFLWDAHQQKYVLTHTDCTGEFAPPIPPSSYRNKEKLIYRGCHRADRKYCYFHPNAYEKKNLLSKMECEPGSWCSGEFSYVTDENGNIWDLRIECIHDTCSEYTCVYVWDTGLGMYRLEKGCREPFGKGIYYLGLPGYAERCRCPPRPIEYIGDRVELVCGRRTLDCTEYIAADASEMLEEHEAREKFCDCVRDSNGQCKDGPKATLYPLNHPILKKPCRCRWVN